MLKDDSYCTGTAESLMYEFEEDKESVPAARCTTESR